MPEIRFDGLSQTVRDVFEEGTVQSKSGAAIPSALVVKALEEIAKISTGPQADMLMSLKNTMINMPVNPDVLNNLPDSAKEALLQTDGRMSQHGQNILQDVLMAPLLGQLGSLHFDPSHYVQQFDKKARASGIHVRFNTRDAKFQTSCRLG